MSGCRCLIKINARYGIHIYGIWYMLVWFMKLSLQLALRINDNGYSTQCLPLNRMKFVAMLTAAIQKTFQHRHRHRYVSISRCPCRGPLNHVHIYVYVYMYIAITARHDGVPATAETESERDSRILMTATVLRIVVAPQWFVLGGGLCEVGCCHINRHT